MPCFNPRSPCGERHPRRVACRTRRARFNPRSPCGERRRTRRWPCARPRCFNPRSPCGERRTNTAQVDSHSQLQPTLPLRGATYQGLSYSEICAFQPTLPLRGATCPSRQPPNRPPSVSTHAPLAGSDEHGESVVTYVAQFQPTLPLRGATSEAVCDLCDLFSFNPRSPCGERREQAGIEARTRSVSTHAPLAGSDATSKKFRAILESFQPTLPLRGATEAGRIEGLDIRVSTPAPLAGSDATVRLSTLSSSGFQPTLPLRGATKSRAANSMAIVFQPTLPLRGATRRATALRPRRTSFNPRSPCGERHEVGRHSLIVPCVSTHAPLAGSDLLNGH